MSEQVNEKQKILIVDDTPENIDILGEILSEYKKFIAINGERALKLAKEKLPDLILLDIMMPGMDGFEVCERLKADGVTRDIPVIFITAKNQIEDEVRGLELGAVDFIAKPISPPIVLARVKNHLELKSAREKIETKNKELAKTLRELKDTQNQLIISEKMSALGQLVAGIAHEINTPIGAINSSNRAIATDLNYILLEAPDIYRSFTPDFEILFRQLLEVTFKKSTTISSREERQYRTNLESLLSSQNIAKSEDIADLLVSLGVYENIDPFIEIIKSDLAEEYLTTAQKLSRIKFRNDIIASAIDKVSKIVFSLKNFARFDGEGKKTNGDIHESIETILTIYYNKLKYGVEVVRDFNIDRVIPFLPDQINQVWMNIVQNALYAMENKGKLTIKTEVLGDYAVIQFTDTGYGISKDKLDRIFEPFFTTKPQGEGTGLGLDIVRKILNNHNGKIEVESELGTGTTFKVSLPLEASE
ncbi:MAG: response regulator [Candidatus Kapabacteria bacterium]|nr:response regulator [Candidatus Kapabacteria bacterium]